MVQSVYIDVYFQQEFCFQQEEIMIQTQVLITSAKELSVLIVQPCIPGTYQISVSSSVRPTVGSKILHAIEYGNVVMRYQFIC